MKRTKSTKKLSLHRNTLRNIDGGDLRGIAGGKTEIVCSASGVCICTDEECVGIKLTRKL